MKLTPVFIKRCHLVAAVMWVGLAIPSLIWWKDSVLWVILISIYANIVGHLSGYSAARADQAAEESEDSTSNKRLMIRGVYDGY
ncbi:transporter [Klebsiella pneumoniae]|nr:transporter [Klebsiella pneumoniae]